MKLEAFEGFLVDVDSRADALIALSRKTARYARLTSPTEYTDFEVYGDRVVLDQTGRMAAVWSASSIQVVQIRPGTVLGVPFKADDKLVHVSWPAVLPGHLLSLTKKGILRLYRVEGEAASLTLEISVRSREAPWLGCVDACHLKGTNSILILLDNGDVLSVGPLSRTTLPKVSDALLINPEPVEIAADYSFIRSFTYGPTHFVLLGWGPSRIDVCLLEEDLFLLESIQLPSGPMGKGLEAKAIDDGTSFLVFSEPRNQTFVLTFPWLPNLFSTDKIRSKLAPLNSSPHLGAVSLRDPVTHQLSVLCPSTSGLKIISLGKEEEKIVQEMPNLNKDQTMAEYCLSLPPAKPEIKYSPIEFIPGKAPALPKATIPKDITLGTMKPLLDYYQNFKLDRLAPLVSSSQALQARIDFIHSAIEKHSLWIKTIQDALATLQVNRSAITGRYAGVKEQGIRLAERTIRLKAELDALKEAASNSTGILANPSNLLHRLDHLATKLGTRSTRPVFANSCIEPVSMKEQTQKIQDISLYLSQLQLRIPNTH